MKTVNFFGTYAAQDQTTLIASVCGCVAFVLLVSAILTVLIVKSKKQKKLNTKMTVAQVKDYVL
jgi:hypothetical protein